jgi:DNA-binding NarL/FixJ family response regulator
MPDRFVLVLVAALPGLILIVIWNARRPRRTEKRLNARVIDGSSLTDRRWNWDLLTARETEVARLVGEGKRNTEIAKELSVSVRTVESHIQHTYEKLGVRNRVELAHVMRDHFH